MALHQSHAKVKLCFNQVMQEFALGQETVLLKQQQNLKNESMSKCDNSAINSIIQHFLFYTYLPIYSNNCIISNYSYLKTCSGNAKIQSYSRVIDS